MDLLTGLTVLLTRFLERNELNILIKIEWCICRGLAGCCNKRENSDKMCEREGGRWLLVMQSAVVRLEVTLLAHFALLRPPEASQDKPLFSSRKKVLGRQSSQGDSAHENQ